MTSDKGGYIHGSLQLQQLKFKPLLLMCVSFAKVFIMITHEPCCNPPGWGSKSFTWTGGPRVGSLRGLSHTSSKSNQSKHRIPRLLTKVVMKNVSLFKKKKICMLHVKNGVEKWRKNKLFYVVFHDIKVTLNRIPRRWCKARSCTHWALWGEIFLHLSAISFLKNTHTRHT